MEKGKELSVVARLVSGFSRQGMGIWGAVSHFVMRRQGDILSHLSYGEGWVFSVTCVPEYMRDFSNYHSVLGSQGEVKFNIDRESFYPEAQYVNYLSRLTGQDWVAGQAVSYKEFCKRSGSIDRNRGPVGAEGQEKLYIHPPAPRD